MAAVASQRRERTGAGQRRSWADRLRRVALGLAGLVPLLGLLGNPPTTALLIFTLFVGVLWQRRRLARAVGGWGLPMPLRFGLLLVATGLIAECFAWLNNFFACRPDPPLLHPQLGPDLINGVMFYGVWAVAWTVVLRRWRFSLGEVFFAQGLFGVVIEQRGAILLQGLATLPLGLIFWLYVLAIYGSIAAIPYTVTACPETIGGQSAGWPKYPALWLLLVVIYLPVGVVWSAGVGPLLPPPQPICERPFW